MEDVEKLPKIPGYRIEKKLGRGGMADVYLGVQETLGRKVAIKVLNPKMIRDQRLLQRFLNEAQTASRLEHPNIVTIHDVGQAEDNCYIVMEYLHGSLVERMKIRPDFKIDKKETFLIIKQVAKALAYAHKEGFIHRDIKPDNILFRRDNTPVLVDFGIARAVDSDSQLTSTGMIIGTPHYMSPEQCRGEKIDSQCDIYSLGIVLYEMLTGDIPYKADSAAGVLIKHIQEPLPQLPRELKRYQPLLDKMVAKEKSQRIRNAEELLELLELYETESQLDTIEISEPEKWVFADSNKIGKGKKGIYDDRPTALPPLKPVKKRRPLLWVFLVLFVVAGAALAYYYFYYLPNVEKKQAGLKQEEEITVKEPVVAAGKEEQTGPPAKKEESETLEDKEYKKFYILAGEYFKNGDMKKARENLNRAGRLKETDDTKALQKQIDDYLEAEFKRYFTRAQDYYDNGNYSKAKENISLARKVKTAKGLESLARQIKKKEEAARRKAGLARRLKRRDDDAYNRAKSRNTIYSYEKYLAKYPSGRHAEAARKRLDQLKSATQLEIKIKDDVAFELASNANTISSYEAYLQKHSFGLHAKNARARIEKLKEKLIRETKIKIDLEHIKFFESDFKAKQVGLRKYETRFSKDTTRYIFTEIKYKNKLYRVADSSNPVIIEYSGAFNQQLKGIIRPYKEAETGLYWRGMGWAQPGKWPTGSYTVTIYVEGQKVGNSRFEIY